MADQGGSSQTSRDAAKLAGGSGIVLAGSLVDRGLRAVITWFLSGALGTRGFGVYSTVITLISMITVFATLGLDTGAVFFGSRYKRAGERDRLKGVLLASVGLSVIAGVVVALGVAGASAAGFVYADKPDIASGAILAAPAVAVWTVLMVLVGGLRAVKDMRGSAIAYQIGLPAALMVGAGVAVALGGGVREVILAFIAANVLSLLLAARIFWRRFGALLRDRAVAARVELGALLGYSVPQSLAASLFRVNLWMDILMLAWLADETQVGLYRVASTLALMGSLTVTAVNTMFNPMVSELVYTREFARLNALLKTVTRWLTVLATPLYMALLLVPDAVLLIFDEDYSASALPLQILVLGQIFQVSLAPANRLIPMAGHSMLNLVNALVAAGLNFGLNYLLIPRYGGAGAAAASAITFALWSCWRVGEVWVMYRCWPFSRRTVAFLAGSAGLTLAAGLGPLALGWGLWPRVAAAAVALGLYAALAWTVGRAPEDAEVAGPAVARLKKKLGRG
jgi:O-antigen/teichoic acid export membrane protein